jgi:hypothetical protein
MVANYADCEATHRHSATTAYGWLTTTHPLAVLALSGSRQPKNQQRQERQRREFNALDSPVWQPHTPFGVAHLRPRRSG